MMKSMPHTYTTHIMMTYHSLPHLMLILSMSTFLLSLLMNTYNYTMVLEWTFLNINSSTLSIPIMLDPMGTMFMSTVTFISFNVLSFSKTYMLSDPHLTRFTHILSMFISSMLLLVMSPNIITMMLGWDGLGITSFLLVIYYQNSSVLKSGMITALTNRIGDALLLIAIGLTTCQGHWNMTNMWAEVLPPITSIMILLAAMTKSAQFPFVAWLPEAMAAPTPVSALVHSSTLVTAGVFILIRLYPFLSQTSMFNSILLTSGLMTSLGGAWWGLGHPDMKKTVALSTLSQLGLMMTSLSLNMVTFCFVHLLTHAMFKATLFMGVGMSIIMKHHRQHKDNIRMHTFMPTVGAASAISLLSMNAFFFLAGYYSKEIILETSLYNPWMFIVLTMMAASTILTVLYSVPLWRILVISPLMFGQAKWALSLNPKEWYINGNNKTLTTPMVFMSIGSICMGSIAFWMFVSPSETPILPDHMHFAPILFPLIGIYTAISSCRITTKVKTKSSAVMLTKSCTTKSIMYKKAMYSSESFLNHYNNLPLVLKIYSKLCILGLNITIWSQKLWTLHSWSNKFFSRMKYYETRQEQLMYTTNKTTSFQKSTVNLRGWMTLSYKTATPIINLSLSSIKALDQGIIQISTAGGIKNLFPKLSSQILSLQSNQLTKMILLFLSMIIIPLPFII